MAKMMNANSINDMTVMNVKSQSQMRLQQLFVKIGKGKRKVKVTLSKMSRSYLNKMFEQMLKQIPEADQKKAPNVVHFINYMDKETKITKENKKIKTKDIMLSFDEYDFLKLQIKEALKELDVRVKKLKWYQFIQKSSHKLMKKQMEQMQEELNKKELTK